MRSLACILIAFASAAALSDEPKDGAVFGDHFRKQDLKAYFSKASPERTQFIAKEDGSGYYVKSTSGLVFRKVPVRADVKYRFSVSVAQKGGDTPEQNPDVDRRIFNYRGGDYPIIRFNFTEKGGKPAASDAVPQGIVLGKLTKTDYVFYAPPRASELEIMFSVPRDITLLVADAEFGPDTMEKSINVNPTFSLGKYNFSGVREFNDGAGRILEKDGKFAMFTGFYMHTSRFPVAPKKTYNMHYRCVGGYFKGRVDAHIQFFDDNCRVISTSDLPRLVKSQPEADFKFIPPEQARYCSFWIYHGTVADTTVTEVAE